MTPSTVRTVLLAGGLFGAGVVSVGCTENGGGPGDPGTAGTTGAGGAAGSGASGGASGGTGGTPGFISIAPCQNESDYVYGTREIDFGLIDGAFAYSPKCLRASWTLGLIQDVVFVGDFSAHQLEPSARRGTQAGNSISATSTGTSTVFQFSTPGFYAYFCQTHNPSDNGAAMSGVFWVHEVLLPDT